VSLVESDLQSMPRDPEKKKNTFTNAEPENQKARAWIHS
jgi:hypothetical protein